MNYRDLLILVAVAIVSCLVIAKADKQFVQLLEAKLYHRGHDVNAARNVYARHKRMISILFFVLGLLIVVVAVMLMNIYPTFAFLAGAIGGVMAIVGIVDRLRSFWAADKELR